jgi:hypothetical protein
LSRNIETQRTRVAWPRQGDWEEKVFDAVREWHAARRLSPQAAFGQLKLRGRSSSSTLLSLTDFQAALRSMLDGTAVGRLRGEPGVSMLGIGPYWLRFADATPVALITKFEDMETAGQGGRRSTCSVCWTGMVRQITRSRSTDRSRSCPRSLSYATDWQAFVRSAAPRAPRAAGDGGLSVAEWTARFGAQAMRY